MGTRFGKPDETRDEERKKPAEGFTPLRGLVSNHLFVQAWRFGDYMKAE